MFAADFSQGSRTNWSVQLRWLLNRRAPPLVPSSVWPTCSSICAFVCSCWNSIFLFLYSTLAVGFLSQLHIHICKYVCMRVMWLVASSRFGECWSDSAGVCGTVALAMAFMLMARVTLCMRTHRMLHSASHLRSSPSCRHMRSWPHNCCCCCHVHVNIFIPLLLYSSCRL